VLLENKVCMIVGAASLRSIGYAAAELFAEQGARVVAVDLVMDARVEAEIRSSIESRLGRQVDLLAMKCDIASAADCEHVVRDMVSKHGRIDCLVNSAGIVRSQSLLDIDEASYDLVVDVNMKGAFNLCQSVLRVMAAQRSGVIVNVASAAAQRGGGLVGGAHYAAAKGGVVSLTRTIAREFGHLGIRANAVCPAMIETGMLDGLAPERLREIVDAIPMKRTGTTREAAGVCLFLASELSGFVTGATIDVNGGSHIH
jgi:NAD(P)-dependent dehydrogenase (short-subunit alcohol dehydrogenase family)